MAERALSSAAGEGPSADRIGGGMKAHQTIRSGEELQTNSLGMA